MRIGLGTYCYYWRSLVERPDRLSLAVMLDEAHALGADVFQICDSPELDRNSTDENRRLRRRASELGLQLEVGTRGVGAEHLRRYLEIAQQLDASLLRTLIPPDRSSQDLEDTKTALNELMPKFEHQGVTLAIETYEQFSTADLMSLVRGVNSPNLGVCIDVANCLASLETPNATIGLVRGYIANVHIKDFAYRRKTGGQGYEVVGCELGTGQLPLDEIVRVAESERAEPALILENWLPWQGDRALTDDLEAAWTRASLSALRRVCARRHGDSTLDRLRGSDGSRPESSTPVV